MCSNYESSASPKELLDRFDLPQLPLMPNKQNIRPTDLALVIETGRNARLLHWGILQPWQEGKNAQPIINARAETLDQKPTFQPLLNRRCLVPATAWFEWRNAEGKKLKNRIALDEAPLFAFAGLTNDMHFTMITCEPTPSIAHIHNRMPVVLTPSAEGAWLDEGNSFTEVSELLVPYADTPLVSDEEKPIQADLFN